MRHSKAITALFLASTAIGTGTVEAATFTQTVDFGTLNNNSIQGAFDLSGLIADERANGNEISSIDSASIYLFGYSPEQNGGSIVVDRNVHRYTHSCGWWSTCDGKYTTTDINTGDHFEDQLSLDFNFGTITDTAVGTDYAYSHYYSNNSPYYRVTALDLIRDGNDFGDLAGSQSLSNVALASLLQNAQLDLIASAMGVVSGVGATLNITYTTTALQNAGEVPLPGALPLMGAGAALAAWNTKRKKAKGAERLACF
jgi:hypothetical protein